MKLWEVLKALDENPEKRFKSVNYNQEELIISMGADCYDLPFRVIDSKRDWQEVKTPVTWQEAFEATMNDRKVTFFLEGFTYGFKKDSEISPEQIAKATWYIED